MVTKQTCETDHYYVGATIDDRFQLLDFIGAGGMACVYRAQETGSPHEYAIKFLKAEYAQQDYLIDYFREEASSMRDLAHPNIVRFYRFVNHPDYSYIVMDYVDGFALSDVLKRLYRLERQIPLDEVVRIMTQVARALDAIHREGYVHRDIKPSNVLIARGTGQTFLTDLGITAAANTRIEGAGTIAYMSPELAATWVADHRADVYSFATMLFELLTQRRPFHVRKGLRGEAAEIDLIEKHRSAPIPNVTHYRPDLPQALDDILKRGLAKDPAERTDSVIELMRAVHQALRPRLSEDLRDFASVRHRQIASPDATVETDQVPAAQPRPQVWMAGIIIAVLLILGAVAAFLATGNGGNNNATAQSTSALDTTGTDITIGQPIYTLVAGTQALMTDANGLTIPVNPNAPRHALRTGDLRDVRVLLDPATVTDVTQYGIILREQTPDDYLAALVDVPARTWALVSINDGIEQTLASGPWPTQETLPSVDVVALGDLIQWTLTPNERVQVRTDQLVAGRPALWVEGTSASARLTLERLSVVLLAEEAVAAAEARPTPVDVTTDTRTSLRNDLAAMVATNDITRSAVNCPEYIAIYESLERHLDSPDADVRFYGAELIEAGEIIYARCRAESPDSALVFLSAIQDYIEWEDALREIQAELPTS